MYSVPSGAGLKGSLDAHPPPSSGSAMLSVAGDVLKVYHQCGTFMKRTSVTHQALTLYHQALCDGACRRARRQQRPSREETRSKNWQAPIKHRRTLTKHRGMLTKVKPCTVWCRCAGGLLARPPPSSGSAALSIGAQWARADTH